LVPDCTSAPNAAAMFIAASESSQADGLMIVVFPSASNAAAIARCVMLFDAGALTLPFTLDGTTVISISFF
jgi:hypothetical protein